MSISNLVGFIGSKIGVSAIDSNAGLTDKKLDVNRERGQTFTFGTADGKANTPYTARFEIATSSTQALDLDANTLKDWFGFTFALSTIKGLAIDHLESSLASDIDVGGNFITTRLGASALLPTEKGSGWSYYTSGAGLLIVPSTGDSLDLINNDGSNIATVEITIFGS